MRADTAAYAAFKARVGDPNPAVRAEAASCEDAPPEVLYYLAQDAEVEVRRQVAANPATPVAANMLLTRDANHSVRCEIAYKAVGAGLEPAERTRMLRMGLTILETLAVDQVVRAKVIKMDQTERKIGLSVKAAGAEGAAEGDVESYRSAREDGSTTIGDVVGDLSGSGAEESKPDAEQEN